MSSSVPNSVTSYYGVGFLGIFSIASYFSITKIWDRYKQQRHDNEDRKFHEELNRKGAEIEDLRRQLAAGEEMARQKEKTWDGIKDEIERARSALEAQLKESHEQNAELTESLQGYEQEVKVARGEAGRLRAASASSGSTFVTKTNSWADTDVIGIVAVLNEEICKTAGLLTEFFQSESSEHREEAVEDEMGVVHEATEYTKEILGAKMTDMLSDFNHRADVALLQYAFQASMCAYSEWITTSWVYRDRDDEQLIQEIYDRLREKEESPVSSSWRILTRRYARQVFRDAPQIDLSDYFFDAFTNIFVTAGLRVGISLDDMTERLKDQFASHVAEIINNAIQLNNAIGDDITSCELVPINCEMGIPFDEDSMENEFGTPTSPFVEESILCTAQLGLLRSEKVRGREGDWTHQILLRPKILLQSAFGISSPLSDDSS
ncbi:hypothetical protein V5O48_007731 [Marasmius crinis-equi]|uniref:Uncharacterized protein n=1 Tax=Marasmius crinis-equi TaxID=585013 RepID=A0ABR3FGJ4_9AGAR